MTVARLSPRGWKHRATNELRDRSFKADTWWRCYDAPVVGGGFNERAHLTGSFNYLTHPVLGRALSSLDGPSMWSGLDGYGRTEG